MQTYGQLRLRVAQRAPGISLELIDGFFQDRYTQILDKLPWKRLEAESVLQCPPSYNIGTITATQGSSLIVGSGTAWTTALDGLTIRINNNQEFYTFTYVSGTEATLDRPYEALTNSITGSAIGAAGMGYNPGDTFWVTGGGSVIAQGTIGSVGAGGAVTTYVLNITGNGYSVANGVVTTTSGSGTGFTLNITSIGASSGLAYRIDQNIFLLPSNARVLRGSRSFHPPTSIEIITPGEMNRLFPGRLTYGTPKYCAQTWDSNSNPPQLQVEFYPIPDSPDSMGNTLSYSVDYIYDPSDIDPTQTSVTLLPWARPAAIIYGVLADCAEEAKDYPLADRREARFKELVTDMAMINALERGPKPIVLAPELRGQRPALPGYHRGKHSYDDYFGPDDFDS